MTRMTRIGNLIWTDSWVEELADLMTYTKMEMSFGPGQGHGGKQTFVKEELFQRNDDGSAVFPAGLLPRVADFLKGRGVRYSLEDRRDLASLKPTPDFDKVELLRDGQDNLLVAVAASDGGLILSATGTGKSFIIRQICAMYPTLKIVVVSSRRSVVKQLYASLRERLLPGAVALVTGGSHMAPARVTVATAASIMKARIEECDLLLYDEAHNVGSNEIGRLLGYAQKARRFGFTASPTRGDGTSMVMEAMFGPVIGEITYEKAVDSNLVVPIEVWIRDIDGHIPDRQMTTARMRTCYWRNGRRNQAIAEDAGLFPEDEQVLIMTSTLEHAVYLQKLLPDFQLVHAGDASSRVVKTIWVWDLLQGGWMETDLKKGDIVGLESYRYLGEYAKVEEFPAWLAPDGTPKKTAAYVVRKTEPRILGLPVTHWNMDQKTLDRIKARFSAGELKKVIATQTWAEGVNEKPCASAMMQYNSFNCWELSEKRQSAAKIV